MIRRFKLPYALVAFCGLFCLLGCSDPIGEEMSAVTSSEQRSTKAEARNVATRFYYYRGEKLFLTPTFEKRGLMPYFQALCCLLKHQAGGVLPML